MARKKRMPDDPINLRGRPVDPATRDLVLWPTRFPADLLTRLKAVAELEHRPITWQIVLFLEQALEAYDARNEVRDPRRQYVGM